MVQEEPTTCSHPIAGKTEETVFLCVQTSPHVWRVPAAEKTKRLFLFLQKSTFSEGFLVQKRPMRLFFCVQKSPMIPVAEKTEAQETLFFPAKETFLWRVPVAENIEETIFLWP